ncbi:hypothetical protein HYW17_04235 [Candidatus Uhrbacteria bacterium]|nr:hypothetical protein [Candidatus Uhrbacteria bacterium]
MQEDTLYRHILREAWKTTWNYKRFWALGLLAVFWGDLGAYQTFNQALERLPGPGFLAGASSLLLPFAGLNFWQFAVLLGLSFIALAVMAALLVLVTAARGGLIWALAKTASPGRKESIPALLKRGARAFFPLLGIGLLTRLDILLYWFLINPLVAQGPSPLTFTLFLLAFVLVTLLSLILSFLGIYAAVLVILDGHTFLQSLREAFSIFAQHWLVSIELALILYFITLLVGVGVLLAMFALGIPLLLAGSIAVFLNVPALLWVIVAVGAAAYLAALLLIGSAFVTFQYASWVLLFMRLREEGATAKIIRLTSRFGHLLHRKVI